MNNEYYSIGIERPYSKPRLHLNQVMTNVFSLPVQQCVDTRHTQSQN